MNYKLEIIGFTIEGCITAQAAGADRIELCDNPGEGGTTPSYGFIKMAREKLAIDLFPIIRPRGGDFLYSQEEFEIMKTDILCCKALGCDGVVTGILTPDGRLDEKRNAALVDLAYPMGVTLHRAFDRVKEGAAALETAIECGFERILTSGFLPNAPDGAGNIKTLVEQAAGRITIMPGSGVRPENLLALAQETGAKEFHSSARIFIDSKMEFNNGAMKETLQSATTASAEIKQMKEILAGFPQSD